MAAQTAYLVSIAPLVLAPCVSNPEPAGPRVPMDTTLTEEPVLSAICLVGPVAAPEETSVPLVRLAGG